MNQITILYSGDIHANVERLLQLAHLAQVQRAELTAVGRHVILVDTGDAEDRACVESDLSRGAALYRLLKAAGYEASVVGNGLLLSYGPSVLAHIASASNLPLLCANLLSRELHPTPVPGVTPTRIIACGPIRVGLIGLTTEIKDTYERFFGVRMPNTIETTRQQLHALQAQGCQVIGVVSHLGYERDVELAETVPELSFIVGGHSHARLAAPRVVYGVPICHAGDRARYLGRLDLMLDEHGKMIEWRGRLLPVRESFPQHQQAADTWALIQHDISRRLAEEIGELTAPAEHASATASGAGQLLADALRECMDADIALCAAGHVGSGLPSGPVTLGDLVRAGFSTANPGVAEITGEQLVHALEFGADPDVWQRMPRPMGGHTIGILQVSGLHYDRTPHAPYGQRVSRVEIGGQPVSLSATYRVAATDFELLPHRGYFPDLDLDDITLDVTRVLRQVVQSYLQAHRPLDPPTVSRIWSGAVGERPGGGREAAAYVGLPTIDEDEVEPDNNAGAADTTSASDARTTPEPPPPDDDPAAWE